MFNGKLSFSKFSVIKGNLPSLPQAEYSEPCLTLPHSLKKNKKIFLSTTVHFHFDVCKMVIRYL